LTGILSRQLEKREVLQKKVNLGRLRERAIIRKRKRSLRREKLKARKVAGRRQAKRFYRRGNIYPWNARTRYRGGSLFRE